MLLKKAHNNACRQVQLLLPEGHWSEGHRLAGEPVDVRRTAHTGREHGYVASTVMVVDGDTALLTAVTDLMQFHLLDVHVQPFDSPR
jgi:hypothetical protein